MERSDTHHLTYDRDGFRFALPILHRSELICFARKRNLDARLRQINTTGKTSQLSASKGLRIALTVSRFGGKAANLVT